MNICGLLHWPRFMAPPPTNSSSPVCSRSPGCICVLLLSVPHTLMPCTHARAHTNTCALFKTMYQPAFWQPCAEMLPSGTSGSLYTRARAHAHAQAQAHTLGRALGLCECTLCWTELSPPREAYLPVRTSSCSLHPAGRTQANQSCMPSRRLPPATCQLGKQCSSIPVTHSWAQADQRPHAGGWHTQSWNRVTFECSYWAHFPGSAAKCPECGVMATQVAGHHPGVWCSGGSPSLGLWTPKFKAYLHWLVLDSPIHLFHPHVVYWQCHRTLAPCILHFFWKLPIHDYKQESVTWWMQSFCFKT